MVYSRFANTLDQKLGQVFDNIDNNEIEMYRLRPPPPHARKNVWRIFENV